MWCLVGGTCTLLHRYPSQSEAAITGWDRYHYFAWARTMVVDKDLDLENDYLHQADLLEQARHPRIYDRYAERDTGYVPNKYGVGLAVLTAPALLLADLLVTITERLRGVKLSEFSAIYPMAYRISLTIVAFLGIWVSFVELRASFPVKVAALAVTLGTAGLSVGYYCCFDPTMAHGAGFSMTVLMIACSRRWIAAVCEDTPAAGLRYAFGSGLFLGLATIVRFPDAVFGIVPVALALSKFNALSQPIVRTRFLGSLATAAGGLLLGLAPQLLVWRVVYGKWVTYSYETEQFSRLPVHVLDVLFSPLNGFFSWTPLAMLCLVGLAGESFRRRPIAISGMVAMIVLAIVYGSWPMWWLGVSYGARGFVDASFFLFFGLAGVFEFCSRRGAPGRVIVAVVVTALTVWNLIFMIAFRYGIQPQGRPFLGIGRILESPKWPGTVGRVFDISAAVRAEKYPLMHRPSSSDMTRSRAENNTPVAGILNHDPDKWMAHVPVVVAKTSNQGISWISGLLLHNPHQHPVDVVLDVHPQPFGKTPQRSLRLLIDPGGIEEMCNVLRSFGIKNGTTGMTISADDALAVSSWIEVLSSKETTWQSVPVLDDVNRADFSVNTAIPVMTNRSSWRTNIGLFNIGDQAQNVVLGWSGGRLSDRPFATIEVRQGEVRLVTDVARRKLAAHTASDPLTAILSTGPGGAAQAILSLVMARSSDALVFPAVQPVPAGSVALLATGFGHRKGPVFGEVWIVNRGDHEGEVILGYGQSPALDFVARRSIRIAPGETLHLQEHGDPSSDYGIEGQLPLIMVAQGDVVVFGAVLDEKKGMGYRFPSVPVVPAASGARSRQILLAPSTTKIVRLALVGEGAVPVTIAVRSASGAVVRDERRESTLEAGTCMDIELSLGEPALIEVTGPGTGIIAAMMCSGGDGMAAPVFRQER